MKFVVVVAWELQSQLYRRASVSWCMGISLTEAGNNLINWNRIRDITPKLVLDKADEVIEALLYEIKSNSTQYTSNSGISRED